LVELPKVPYKAINTFNDREKKLFVGCKFLRRTNSVYFNSSANTNTMATKFHYILVAVLALIILWIPWNNTLDYEKEYYTIFLFFFYFNNCVG